MRVLWIVQIWLKELVKLGILLVGKNVSFDTANGHLPPNFFNENLYTSYWNLSEVILILIIDPGAI